MATHTFRRLSPPRLIGLAGLLLVPLLGGAALAAQAPSVDDDAEKQAAMEKIRAHLESGEWKRAGKSLRTYRKKHADTDEEKAEVDALVDKAEGFEAFEKIQKAYQRRSKARKAAEELRELLEDFRHVADLVEQAEKYLEGVRSSYVLVLDDFEAWPDPEAEAAMDDEEKKNLPPRMKGVVLESDPEAVKQGRRSGRFTSKRGGGSVTIPARQEDWSPYAFLCFWLRNDQVDPKNIQHLRVNIRCSTGGSFETVISLNYVGWKEHRLLMKTKKGVFGRSGIAADWSAVSWASMWHADLVRKPLDLLFDDVRLEKAVR